MDTPTDGEMTPEDLPLFQALSTSCRTDLLNNAIVHGVGPGTVLFEQGAAPNFQFLVMSGSAQLFGKSATEREVLIEVIHAPDLVIPAAVVTGAPYLMQARVPEPSRFLSINSTVFRAAVAADPVLAQAVIRSLAQQFRRMVRQIKNLKLRTSTERVGCYILNLAHQQGTPDRAVFPYEKNLIASELGIARESFSRALSTLEKSGISVDGQKITILNRARLAAACNPDPLIDDNDVA